MSWRRKPVVLCISILPIYNCTTYVLVVLIQYKTSIAFVMLVAYDSAFSHANLFS